jgi:dTDP-4-dehydrorhamnose 3,5-epimerase-like enzyme
MRVIVERIEPKSDARGCVWEPATPAEIVQQQNCHVVVTEPGGIRGNHFHKRGTEIATQRGPALVRYRDERGVQDVQIAEDEVVRFVFPPNCAHAFQNTGSTPNLLIAFNTVRHDPATLDVYPEVLIPATAR